MVQDHKHEWVTIDAGYDKDESIFILRKYCECETYKLFTVDAEEIE